MSCFISGTFHLIFAEHSFRLQITKTMESEITNKGDYGIGNEILCSHKKEGNLVITWMLSKISQTKGEK